MLVAADPALAPVTLFAPAALAFLPYLRAPLVAANTLYLAFNLPRCLPHALPRYQQLIGWLRGATDLRHTVFGALAAAAVAGLDACLLLAAIPSRLPLPHV